jgi:predicted oxidoreductase
MNKIYLSDSGPKVSPAVYGFYRWQEECVTENNMAKIIDQCLDLGINTFDLGDFYGGYQCEKVFGDVISQRGINREDLVLFSQCGTNIPHASRPEYRVKHYNTSAQHIKASLERSLNDLQTDYIDIYLLNQLDSISDLEETAMTLQQLKNNGKIRNIGVVNFSVFQHQLLSTRLRSPIVSNHVVLNLLNTTAFDNGQIDYIKQRYMRPLALSPLAEGKIAESTEALPIKVRTKLEELSLKYNAGIEALAASWVIKLGALPLVGTMNTKRIKHLVNAFDIDLDHQDWYSLYEAAGH